MGEILFFGALMLILVLFIIRTSVARFLFQTTGLAIGTKGVTVGLIGAVVIVFALGVITADQKSRYAGISDAFENIRPGDPDEQREDMEEEPHRWFSFNFDFFNF